MFISHKDFFWNFYPSPTLFQAIQDEQWISLACLCCVATKSEEAWGLVSLERQPGLSCSTISLDIDI